MNTTRKRTITVHISPYVGGLALETYDFIPQLNEEAKRLRTGVNFNALANRILAHGILERALKFTNTLGAWQLRRAFADGYLAHRPQPRWETSAIEGEEDVLRRGNSGHRNELRRFEKNRYPVKCRCQFCDEDFECQSIGEPPDVCERCKIDNTLKIVAATLYHLVCAIPQMERDREEIYPADFRHPRVPLWRREKMRLPGIGLRNYSEPARLLFKDGRYEPVTRQKAASLVCCVPTTPQLTDFYLWLLVWLPSPETQQLLKRLGRLYKNGCYWSKKDPPCVFDKGIASRPRIIVNPPDARLIAKREIRQVRREGGRVIYLGTPGPRHEGLARSRGAYNEQWASYLNSRGLSRALRERRSLNIPRETMAIRDKMIANLEHDFGPDDQSKVA